MALIMTKGKSLSVFSLVMINIIAVDSLRTLPISAEYGFSLVFYYLLAAVVFFVPVALVSAELATGLPETGGLYVWVREAFGKRWGLVTIWLQWLYNVVWYPTIMVFIASAIAYLFSPSLAKNKIYLFSSGGIIFWGATLLNFFGMRVSSFVSILGAVLGTLLPMAFIVILAAFWLLGGNTSAISFSSASFYPDFTHLENTVLFTGLLFGLVGMEMSAVHAGDVKNPQRDYPKALFYSTLIILTTLILGSLAVAVVIPQEKLSLVTGLIDAFVVFFDAYHLKSLMPVVIIMIILGGISGVSTWIIGPTKGLMIAANDGSLPRPLMRVNRYGAPTAILLLQAVIFTGLSAASIFSENLNASYWMLSALTAQLAMVVYLLMFAAAIYLRFKKPEVKRAFTIPGGKWAMLLVAGFGFLTCLFAVFIGFLPPAQVHIKQLYFYEGFLLTGILLSVLSCLLLVRKKNQSI